MSSTTATTAATSDPIIVVMRAMKTALPMVSIFLPPIAQPLVAGAVSLEPVAEQIEAMIRNFMTAGADHTGAVASVGTILQQAGQELMKLGVMSPPPVTR